MSDELIELCPICIESPIQYYTECNHGYCIGCLCRIKKCAMCRNPLQRAKICIQIKEKVRLNDPEENPIIFNDRTDFDRRINVSISRNGDLITRTYLSVTLPEFNSINNRNIFNNPRGILNPTSHLIDSVNYNDEEYNPFISYYGQFPSDPISSRNSRQRNNNIWQMRRGINNHSRSVDHRWLN